MRLMRIVGLRDLPLDDRQPRRDGRAASVGALAPRSEWTFAFFARVFERALRNNFHALRIAALPSASLRGMPRLVVYSNHPSWWDGAVYVFLAKRLFPARTGYTPIDAAMLERYAFFGRIGAFGIERGKASGARRFLQACRQIFADESNVMFITAQGRFADPRERPLRLERGIAHVCDVAPGAMFLPLALEYTHWLEKRPELLLRFGEPVSGNELTALPAAERLHRLDAALTLTMDKLAAASIARDETAFETILAGRAGIDFFYDLWRWGKAVARGRSFHAGHGGRP